jgi:hypothetical protein
MGKHVAGSGASNGMQVGDPQKRAPHRMQGPCWSAGLPMEALL